MKYFRAHDAFRVVKRKVVTASALTERHLTMRRLAVAGECAFVSKFRHDLPHKLIVSLTSYPPRFPHLHLTLRCLLSQRVCADQVVLWVSYDDFPLLPEKVLELKAYGLQINQCSDIRSYKKIIPALDRYKDCFIAIADDDAYYPPGWLEQITNAWQSRSNEIVCHRAHKIRLNSDGLPLPYSCWDWVTKTKYRSTLLFPTGVGGVLYPPGALDPRVVDEALFLDLCPTADDIWLYWMARLNGKEFKLVDRPMRRVLTWPHTQEHGLGRVNNGISAANDRQVENMIDAFGFPG